MRSISVKRSNNGLLTDAVSVSDHALYVTLAGGIGTEIEVPEGANIVIVSRIVGTSDIYLRLGSEPIANAPIDGVITDIVPNPYARILAGEDKLQLFVETSCRVCLEFYK